MDVREAAGATDPATPGRVLPRAAAAAVERAAGVAPVVVLLGARQTGKTTLLRALPLLEERPYLNLDDFDLRLQADAEPEAVVARAPALVLDEVQRSRDLLIAVKRSVDADSGRTPGRFVLTGSANLLMMERIGETLAGRAVYVTLWPFTRRERLGLGRAGVWSELMTTPSDHWRDMLETPAAGIDDRRDVPGAPRTLVEDWRVAATLGGLPVPSYRLTNDDERALWFSGYVQTYLERDLQALRAVENLADFRRLMRAACLRIGNLVNQTDLARDVGIGQPQVHRFLNLMETSYQAVRLPAFALNRSRRLIKSPKLYWSDTALALFLAGEHEPRGAHLENLVLTDLLAWRDLQARRPEVLYWRTATGLEVDFVVEAADRLLPIEVKASARVSTADARGLEAFLDDYADLADGGLLLYTGTETFPLTRRVLAAPWWRVI
jgi:predicted AAA+ superfamily ATPase